MAAFIGLVFGAAAAHAAVDPALFQALHWRSIGPYRGGRVLAVAGVPGQPLHYYFGAVNGGIWETRDAGRTWNPIFDSMPVGSIGALALAPSRPDTIYAGTGEADMRSDIAQGIGLYKSTDGGRNWVFIGLRDTQQIGKILVDPRDPNLVLVAALGHPYGPNAERGVFRSADGGRTWTKTLYKNADTGAIDLAFRPGDPNTVYAALWQTRRPPWNVYPPSDGPGSGLYKSTDGGRSWRQISGRGFPGTVGRIGLAVAPSRRDRVFALVDAKAGGLYRSDDDGANWLKVSGDARIWERGWYFGGVTANPKNADEVYVCNTILLRSTDGGKHFMALKGDPTGDDFHALWIDRNVPERRILGSDQGALVTLDGGATWSSWFNQPTGQFYHVATDNRFPYRVYGAQQDSGAAAIPSRTGTIDGISMPQFHEIAVGGESGSIAPDPSDPDTVYGGRVQKLDLRTGQTRDVDPTLAFPGNARSTWTSPLVFGKRDHALYFGNQRIFRTVDGGAHWMPISPDLTRPDPAVPPNLDVSAAADEQHIGPRRGVVYSIATSPFADGTIWVGTDDGLVWRTKDGGAHWQDATPKGLSAWSKIGAIEPSHFEPDSAIVAVDRHRLDDFSPYAYRTRDGGRTWTAIVHGLAQPGALNVVNVVREDSLRHGLLFAGTERGAFVSFDDGLQWRALQRGLPATSVRDIEVHGDDLVIATHGRGFFVMDDIAPLRALADDASGGPRLFPPVAAVRFRPHGFTGTPMPKDEPMAPNPPDGAYIDYALAAPPKTPLRLAIYDAHGGFVRGFASDTKTPAPALAKIASAPEWTPTPQPLRATPGQHRFVWDLRYEQPAVLAGGERGAHGVWAPPGRYTVELEVDGRKLRQSLEVEPDPRVKTSPAAYAEEFALARAVESARARVRTALREANKLHDALQQQAAKSAPRRKAALLALDARLTIVCDLPSEDSRNSMPPALHSPSALQDLSNAFDSLADAADGADGAPTPDVQEGFHLRAQTLAATLREWEALTTEITAALARR